MLAGLIIVPLVSLLSKAPDKAAVEHCFLGYEQTITVKVRDALGNDGK